MRSKLFNMDWGKKKPATWKTSEDVFSKDYEDIYGDDPFVADCPTCNQQPDKPKVKQKVNKRYIFWLCYISGCSLYCTFKILASLIGLFL